MPAGTKLTGVPGPYFTWIGLNTQHEKLKDIRVRKAIQRAIDVNRSSMPPMAESRRSAHGIVTEGVTGHRTSRNTPTIPMRRARF